jgi:hypothetical protein
MKWADLYLVSGLSSVSFFILHYLAGRLNKVAYLLALVAVLITIMVITHET